MAFIEPMHRNKPNITYLLTYLLDHDETGSSPEPEHWLKNPRIWLKTTQGEPSDPARLHNILL